ncbi:MAG: TfuA domain-containing protein [Deltaproteobacteria bacterium]|nr:TfuA domain-containing protein [Deltaproteobacteria bacterium]
MRPSDLVVFLGPSLPAAAARRLAPCTVLPPARQGDVWRALARRPRPRAIALVDGLFEQVPSVWHRELLGALDAGVAVFGGGSMGAIRAAELAPYGMVGVGTIARWYREGLDDDAAVALLHAGAEHGFRPFTVPLVNAWHAADRARARGVVTRSESDSIRAAAGGLPYPDRTWPAILRAAGRSLGPAGRERWAAFAARGLPDLKAADARATIRAAARWLQRRGGARPGRR